MDSSLVPILLGIVPSIGVGLLFWFVMRTIIRADRNERAAIAAQEAEHAAESKRASQPQPDAARDAQDEANAG